MNHTTLRRDGEFRFALPKSGSDVVAGTFDRFKGQDVIGLRVWRATGNEGEYHSMLNGLNLLPADMACAWHYVKTMLDGRCGDVDESIDCFQMPQGKFLRVQRQTFRGADLIACRVWRRGKAGLSTPTTNGLTIRPDLWAAILPKLRKVLEEIVDMEQVDEAFENAVIAEMKRVYGAVL